jgi:GMP synthase (glutamine-hydrolysing)
MLTPYPHIAVIHHLEQPFLGNAAAPLGPVHEHFDSLPDLDAVDAIVSFGGAQDAWEPRYEPERELIREAVAREIPYLGVCLGAQLLAHALGGEVARLPKRMISWEPLTVIAEDPVLGAIPAGAHALHFNQDGIEPPPGAVEVYARPRGGRAEGFRVGRLAWGIQFHPEVDAAALDGWYAGWPEALGQAGVTEADARAADARRLPGQAALSTAIFGAFARVARAKVHEAHV